MIIRIGQYEKISINDNTKEMLELAADKCNYGPCASNLG